MNSITSEPETEVVGSIKGLVARQRGRRGPGAHVVHPRHEQHRDRLGYSSHAPVEEAQVSTVHDKRAFKLK